MKVFLKGVLLVFLVLVVVLAAGRNVIIKAVVEHGVRIVTGLPLEIETLEVGLARPVLDVRGLTLSNPPDFPDPVMAEVPEIYVRYDLPAILGGTLHLPEVRLHLKKFAVVRAADGRLNLDALKALQASASKEGKAPGRPEKRPPAKPAEEMALRIDSLDLKIGEVVSKDYSGAGGPTVRRFKLGIDEHLEDIDSPQTLVRRIVLKVFSVTKIPDMLPAGIQGAAALLGDTVTTAGKAAAGVVGSVGGTLEKTTDRIKKLLPFQKE